MNSQAREVLSGTEMLCTWVDHRASERAMEDAREFFAASHRETRAMYARRIRHAAAQALKNRAAAVGAQS